MPTNRLSDAKVRALKPAEKPCKISDGGGLYLLVLPTGSKLWRVAYRHGGKQKTLALGPYPDVGLAEAREGLRTAKSLLREGRDPVQARRADRRRASTPANPTFRSAAERWFAARQAAWVPSYADRIWRRIESDLLPNLGGSLLSDVSRNDALDALRKIEARGAIETARRVKQYVADIYRFARAEGYAVDSPVEELAHALAAPGPKRRRTALLARDLPKFLEALAGYDGDPRISLALELTLLTFVRTNEIRFARWQEFEDLDGESPLWRIPAQRMKMRTEHLVPLSIQAVETVQAIRRLTGPDDLLLRAPTRSGVISENTMIYAIYRMGFHSRATVHGFRGTASTVLNEQGFNRDWIERQLAHVEGNDIRAAYNSAEWLSDRRAMMQWWADYLDTQIKAASAKAAQN